MWSRSGVEFIWLTNITAEALSYVDIIIFKTCNTSYSYNRAKNYANLLIILGLKHLFYKQKLIIDDFEIDNFKIDDFGIYDSEIDNF